MKNSVKKDVWRKFFVAAIILYIVAAIIAVIIIFNIPALYNANQENIHNKSEQAITEIIENREEIFSNKEQAFADLASRRNIEFLVFNQTTDELVFSTIPIQITNVDATILNSNAIFKERFFVKEANGVAYYIWVASYFESPQESFNFWMTSFIAIILMIFTIFIITFWLFFRRMIAPLQRLQKNIMRVSTFQLEQITNEDKTSEFDALSYELYTFAQDLQDKFDEYGQSYTSLERVMQEQNELMEYKTRIIATIAHDLKTPLHIARLNVEEVKVEERIPNYLKEKMQVAEQKMDMTIESINDMVKIARQTKVEQLKIIETFDLIPMMMNVYEMFDDLIQRKNFSIEFDVDEHVVVSVNRIRMKQLIYNAMSNICYYAKENAEVVVACFVEDDIVTMSFYNDAEQMTTDQLNNIFKLFYRIGNKNDGGLGTGLYTLREIAKEFGGDATFYNKDNGVELAVMFPLKKVK